MYKIHGDFPGRKEVSGLELDRILGLPVLKTQYFPEPLIIKSFDFIFNHGLHFLRVRTQCGREGVSVASGRAKYLSPILKDLILPYFIGKDARDLDALVDGVYVAGSNYKLAGLALFCCISWAEAAVLDLLGGVAGKPVGALVGDICRDSFQIYVASGNRGTTPEEEIEILDRRVAETGAPAVKFKVGGRMSRNADSIEGRSEKLLADTRAHFGDDFIIHADANGSYDAAKGIEIGKICEDINAYFYEEPCPFDDLWDTKAVADALSIPLAFGEQETSLRRFKWIVENGGADVLQPDLQYNGGFIRCVRAARMAEAAGMVVTPHVSGGFASVYALHFIGCIPNAGKYHEYKDFNECAPVFERSLEPKDGVLRIPDGPGLGMTIDPAILRRGMKLFSV